MVLSDIEIANSVTMEPISKVADQLGIDKETLCLYGKYKAKIDARQLVALKDKPDGKLILVTA
ncbi:TPA: formate--tetrahydrofolate ligase, partial [Streptococcus pyogenes]|nr:formate--tetrahydrofolate ligase [Streptococcus pyogenes]